MPKTLRDLKAALDAMSDAELDRPIIFSIYDENRGDVLLHWNGEFTEYTFVTSRETGVELDMTG